MPFSTLNSGNFSLEIHDANNCIEKNAFEIKEPINNENLIKVSPNPFSNQISISEIPVYFMGKKLKIIDNTGKIILTKKINSFEQKINMSQFDNGIFYLQIDNWIKKVIKE